MKRAYRIRLNPEQEDDLRRFARSQTLPARLVQRSKMLLLYATGNSVEEIAEQLGVVRQTVSR
jgi:DNA-binding NarL/FixJ family response regulator